MFQSLTRAIAGSAVALAILATPASAAERLAAWCPLGVTGPEFFVQGTPSAASMLFPRADYVGSTDAPAAQPTPGPVDKPIAVHWHVITAADGVRGDVSDARIEKQIQHLNATFSGRAEFTLASIDRTANDAWFTMRAGSAEERAAKDALRQGGADDLNVYSTEEPDGFSWATFPWNYTRNPERDGIVIQHTTVPLVSTIQLPIPGGAGAPEGDTAVHEVGHWLGLWHTFQNGCVVPKGRNKPSGDEVSDTPAQAAPSEGCPEGADTCPAPGTDPIHNFMDYSTDPCQTEFTPGQHARMDSMWVSYRQGK